jgi:hypothetical protein
MPMSPPPPHQRDCRCRRRHRHRRIPDLLMGSISRSVAIKNVASSMGVVPNSCRTAFVPPIVPRVRTRPAAPSFSTVSQQTAVAGVVARLPRRPRQDGVSNSANPFRASSCSSSSSLSLWTSSEQDVVNVLVQQQQQPPPPPPQSFEPELNAPATSVFLLIAVLFLSLQWRIAAVADATQERSAALARLRRAKVAALTADAGKPATAASRSGGDSVDNHTDTAQKALADYEAAYWRVENLRTLLPGVRVITPPSQSVNAKVAQDNDAAARQFLGIINAEPSSATKDVATATTRTEKQEAKAAENESSAALARNLTLGVVALSQIALLLFLLFTDPMATSNTIDSASLR